MLISGLIHSHHINHCLLARILLCLAGETPWCSFSALPERPIYPMSLSLFNCLLDGSGSPVNLLRYHCPSDKRVAIASFLYYLLVSLGKAWLYWLSSKGMVVGERKVSRESLLKSWRSWTRWGTANRCPVPSPQPPGPLTGSTMPFFSWGVQHSIPGSHCQFLKIGI